jgi:hypothetical protein
MISLLGKTNHDSPAFCIAALFWEGLPCVFNEPGDTVMNTTRKKHLSKTWFLALMLAVAGYLLAMGPSLAQQLATVNCPAESIQAAIDAATPGGALIITVNGICNENILIEREEVRLQNGTGGGVTGVVAGVPSIEIRGASGAVIDGLTVSGGLGDGISARANAAVTVRNSTIESHAGNGVDAGNGGFALIDNNTIRFNGACEIIAFDAGMARVRNNTIVSNNPDPFDCSAVGVFGARMRLDGGNSVTNTTATGTAIGVFQDGTLRQGTPHDTVSGLVGVTSHSFADFRDVAITGDVFLSQNSNLRIRDLGSVPSNVTVTGNLNINETDIVQFVGSAPATINGAVNCNGGTLFGSPIVSGGTGVNCPAPLHVLRSNGTAKVLAEDDQVPANPAVPQTMFELRRPGALRFDLVDENNGTTWVFQNRNDAFDITKAGTGVQEFKLESNGNLIIRGTLTQLSDVNAKEDFTEVDGQSILTRLAALPLTQWRYKRDTSRSQHLGPTAQAFHAAFGLGADDKHIAPADAAGVALVGVKELHKMIEAREAEIAKRDAEIAALKQRLAALEAREVRLQALEAAVQQLLAVTPPARVTAAALR